MEISSSNFPYFSRNLNIVESPNFRSTYQSVNQVLLHDWQHPSFIELPVNYGVKISSSLVTSGQ